MLILLWSSDQEFVSHQTCGYRARKPRLYLGGIRREGLHRKGFVDIHTDAAGWFTERGNTRGLVTGPAQLALALRRGIDKKQKRVSMGVL